MALGLPFLRRLLAATEDERADILRSHPGRDNEFLLTSHERFRPPTLNF
jgi:hypothetical protein